MLHRTFLKRLPLFIWLLFAVSWCLVSALTQAGGGGLLFRFASSVQSCCGEGGALQAAVAVCGEPSPCPGRAARGLAASPWARRAPSLRGPSARRRSGLRKSSDRTRGLFAGREGVASLGLSLPLSPPPRLLPPAGMGRLFSGVSQSLCFANRRRCVPPGQFFSRSPTV